MKEAEDKNQEYRLMSGNTTYFDGKKMASGVLYDYDPDCSHELDPNCWSGIRCKKCSGWFCY